MIVDRIDGAHGPYYRVQIEGAVIVVGPKTLAHRDRLAESLVAQTGHLGSCNMKTDAQQICTRIADKATRLRGDLDGRLPGLVLAKTLIGLATLESELGKLTDAVEGAKASTADGAGGTDK